MKIYLDTNVLCDYLFGPQRQEFDSSLRIFDAALKNQIEAYLSVQSVNDAGYIYTERYNARVNEFKTKIKLILKGSVRLVSILPETTLSALSGSFPDMEDEQQLLCAIDNGCRYFITSEKTILEKQPFENIEAILPSSFIEKSNESL